MRLLTIWFAETPVSVAGRILFMDECVRKSDRDYSFIARNGMEIKSDEYPEITTNTIYLRGRDSAADDAISVLFPDDGKKLIYNIIDALEDFLAYINNIPFVIVKSRQSGMDYIVDFFDCDESPQLFSME